MSVNAASGTSAGHSIDASRVDLLATVVCFADCETQMQSNSNTTCFVVKAKAIQGDGQATSHHHAGKLQPAIGRCARAQVAQI
jgi:hypothetical protein